VCVCVCVCVCPSQGKDAEHISVQLNDLSVKDIMERYEANRKGFLSRINHYLNPFMYVYRFAQRRKERKKLKELQLKDTEATEKQKQDGAPTQE